jgi:hypothetical protein
MPNAVCNSQDEFERFCAEIESRGLNGLAAQLWQTWSRIWLKNHHKEASDWHSPTRFAALTPTSINNIVLKTCKELSKSIQNESELPGVYVEFNAVHEQLVGDLRVIIPRQLVEYTCLNEVALIPPWEGLSSKSVYQGMGWCDDDGEYTQLCPLTVFIHGLKVYCDVKGLSPPEVVQRSACLYAAESGDRNMYGGLMGKDHVTIITERKEDYRRSKDLFGALFKQLWEGPDNCVNTDYVAVAGIFGSAYVKYAVQEKLPLPKAFAFAFDKSDFVHSHNGKSTKSTKVLCSGFSNLYSVVDSFGGLHALDQTSRMNVIKKGVIALKSGKSSIIKGIDVLLINSQTLRCYGLAESLDNIKLWSPKFEVGRDLLMEINAQRSEAPLTFDAMVGSLEMATAPPGKVIPRGMYGKRNYVPGVLLTPGGCHEEARFAPYQCLKCNWITQSYRGVPARCNQCRREELVLYSPPAAAPKECDNEVEDPRAARARARAGDCNPRALFTGALPACKKPSTKSKPAAKKTAAKKTAAKK